MKKDNILKELVGATYNGSQYLIESDTSISRLSHQTSVVSIKDLFKTLFLPENYPQSVSDDYVSYQIWDTVQAFCSSISGALAARAMFESIGVGDENASVYGATLTWIIKDGTGMIGRILFAFYKGSSLDADSKMWRLYADILNDFSFFVDLITPFFVKSYSIYFISFSGLLRSIVGIAGGATRSALTQHQARNNNLADVSAKDNSQETLVNLIALLFNLMLLNYVKDSKILIWQLFFLFVIGHLFANYKAVKSVVIQTFNRNRFHILMQAYLRSNWKLIQSPVQVNNQEPVLFTVSRYFKDIKLGCSINNFNSLSDKQLETFSTENYLINFDLKKKKCFILLNEKCSDMDQLKALFQIEINEFAFSQNVKNAPALNVAKKALEKYDVPLTCNQSSFDIANSKFDEFVEKAKEKDWSFAYTQFCPGLYKYRLESNRKID